MSLRVNNALWIISDTHFGHDNIIRYCQRPKNHEVIMLSNWIERVPENHQILHMGDVFMGRDGNANRWALVVSRLPGEKFLMMGNHDRAKTSTYERAGFTIVEPFVVNGYAFTHRPITPSWPAEWGVDEWHTNIHGHIHNNPWLPQFEGTPLEGRRYINLSVEATDLAPVQLGNVWEPWQ